MVIKNENNFATFKKLIIAHKNKKAKILKKENYIVIEKTNLTIN